MPDLASNFIGITSPNPFWLASAPPTDKNYSVCRVSEVGWGRVVWKSPGSEGPTIVNLSGPRDGVVDGADRRVLWVNSIESIPDRQLRLNLDEMRRIMRDWVGVDSAAGGEELTVTAVPQGRDAAADLHLSLTGG